MKKKENARLLCKNVLPAYFKELRLMKHVTAEDGMGV